MSVIVQETRSLHSIIDNQLRKCFSTNQAPSTKLCRNIIKISNACFSQRDIVDEKYINERHAKITEYMESTRKLRLIPMIVQRSESWFTARNSMISASDVAQAIGKGKFGTQKEFFRKKCGFEDTVFDNTCPPLKHGCMFEDVCCKIYELRNAATVYEFGLLRHPSPILHFIGASPDGITSEGILLEIKAPYRRKITGEVPEQYMYQIQFQLFVCDLRECDFAEFAFNFFSTAEDFFDERNSPRSETGIIGETKIGKEYKYFYGDVNGSDEYYRQWLRDHESLCYKFHYWRLETYNVVRVYRDDRLIHETTCELHRVWDKVVSYRRDRALYDKDISVKKTRSKNLISNVSQPTNGFAFVQDE